MTTPTLIGMPEPPSNPDTPTEAPGTPNSTTTSLSTLSTTAIKDGHRGASLPHERGHHHHTPSSNTLEAERADRISRLAGLERVSTLRPSNANPNTGAGTSTNVGQIPGYFDQNGNPVYTTKMSTVGSASATGSVGGRTTTWGSQRAEGQEDDEMSMDTNFRDIDERDRYSTSALDQDEAMDQDGMSDDASLVGFGEGAGSTVSGPIYTRRDVASPILGRTGSSLANQVQSGGPSTPANIDRERRDARMIDGLADDAPGYVDTAARGGRGTGVESAERILRERFEEGGEGRNKPLGSPDDSKFYYEDKK